MTDIKSRLDAWMKDKNLTDCRNCGKAGTMEGLPTPHILYNPVDVKPGKLSFLGTIVGACECSACAAVVMYSLASVAKAYGDSVKAERTEFEI